MDIIGVDRKHKRVPENIVWNYAHERRTNDSDDFRQAQSPHAQIRA